ncbi:MAG TPA: hypothetical protein VFG25_07075 [Nitrosopumilaceae archaeon]|nr:hypothetical protein [Nitrosopumilaceae archaeon]
MMNKPPKTTSREEICPMCKRPKSKHTSEELAACSKKMIEFNKKKTGGAGIE